MAPTRKTLRSKLLTQAFFAQAPATTTTIPLKCPLDDSCTKKDHASCHREAKSCNEAAGEGISSELKAWRDVARWLGEYVGKGESPVLVQEVRNVYGSAGAKVGAYFVERGIIEEEGDGFKMSRFREEMDDEWAVDAEFRDSGSASVASEGEVEQVVEPKVESCDVVTDLARPFAKKSRKRRRGRRKRREETYAGSSGLEGDHHDVELTTAGGTGVEHSAERCHGNAPNADSGCDLHSNVKRSTEAVESAESGLQWTTTGYDPVGRGRVSLGGDITTPRGIKQKTKRRRKRKKKSIMASLGTEQNICTKSKKESRATSPEVTSRAQKESAIPPVFDTSQDLLFTTAESNGFQDDLTATSDNSDRFTARFTREEDLVGNLIFLDEVERREQATRRSTLSVRDQILAVGKSAKGKSDSLYYSICFAVYDVRLFNIEKRWGLVEEQTARTDHELRRLLGEKGTESLPWSLREALNDPGMCSQAVNSLDEQVKGKRLGGEDAAVEAMSQRSRAINDIRSVRGLDRRIRATRSRHATFFNEPIAKAIPKKIRQKLLDLEYMISEISAARESLFEMRDNVGKLVLSWATASQQAWILGKTRFPEVPLIVDYDYRRVSVLAMYENAKVLDYTVVAYFASQAGRSCLTPSLSTRFMFHKFPNQEATSREVLWDKRIVGLRAVLPTVAWIIGRVEKFMDQVSESVRGRQDGGRQDHVETIRTIFDGPDQSVLTDELHYLGLL